MLEAGGQHAWRDLFSRLRERVVAMAAAGGTCAKWRDFDVAVLGGTVVKWCGRRARRQSGGQADGRQAALSARGERDWLLPG